MGLEDEGKATIQTAQNGATENGALVEQNIAPKTLTDVEGPSKKLPYPKSVFFIISNEFCERFNFYGMKTILVLYLTEKLFFDDNTATVLYHAFTTLVYFICIFGAVISDSWWGKFKTIFYLSIIYSIGSTIISLGAIPTLNISGRVATCIGLLLIAIGSGGIKPCVAAFGGDQFKLPAQAAQMATFFSLFYFSINCGSLISTAITPILRQDVHCFDESDCYSLAFGVPGALMIASIVFFLIGKPLYKIVPPSGNMVVSVAKCISNAISTKGREKKTKPRDHWLDYSEEKYGKQLVQDTKILLKVLVLYVPLPLFWALFDQQGSRWTFQATRMDGDIGFYEIKPDQMQVINPFLILAFIPLYDAIFYPLLSKVGISRPLQKLTAGGILAGVAFLLSAFVELELEKTYPVLPSAHVAQLRVFNGLPCDYTAVTNITGVESFTLRGLQAFEAKHIRIPHENHPSYFHYTFTSTINGNSQCPLKIEGSLNLDSNTAKSLFVTGSNVAAGDLYIDDPNKARTPLVRFLVTAKTTRSLSVRPASNNKLETFSGNTTHRGLVPLTATEYEVYIDGKPIVSFTLRQGSVNTIIIREDLESGKYAHTVAEIAKPNTMSMLWLVPQYVVMTLGEVMFSVTGLSFSYSQAPESMKSVLQAFWLLAVAFGNIIVIIIASSRIFTSQANEFFLFAVLMFLDMLVFMVLAYNYKNVNDNNSSEIETEIESNNEITTKAYTDEKEDDKSTSTAPAGITTADITPTETVNGVQKKD